MRRSLLVTFLLLVVSPAQAQRATVFDGSFDKADIFVVDLGDPAPLSRGIGGLTCLGTSHVSPGGDTTPSPQDPAVLPATFGPSNALRDYVAGRPPLPPLAIDGLLNDCDVVSDFAQVQAYLNQVLLDANARVTSMNQCMLQVEQAYCDFVATVEAATVVQNNFIVDGVDPYYMGDSVCKQLSPLGSFGDRCERARDEITEEIPSHFDDIDMELAFCEAVREDLVAVRVTIPSELNQFQGPDLLEWADAQLAFAQDNYDCLQDLHADLADIVGSINLPYAQAGCDDCGGPGPGLGLVLDTSTILDVGPDSGILLGIASIFAATATIVPDVDLAARYTLLAQNLGNIPAERVLRIEVPSEGPGEAIMLGLRDGALPDDGVSPLAVLLRLVPVAPGTSANPLDRRVMRDAWRALSRAVDPGATVADLDDDDSDGVRDSFETQTGTFASHSDTGTSSDFVDSDGDRFTDGAELFAGTDPNDLMSYPMAALATLPALGPVATTVMGVVVSGLGAAMLRRRSRRTPHVD